MSEPKPDVASPAPAPRVGFVFACCEHGHVTLVARGATGAAAHIHFDIDTAEALWRQLAEAIVEVRASK